MARCPRGLCFALTIVLAAGLGPQLLSAGPIRPPEQGLGWAVPSWPRGIGRWAAGRRFCSSAGAAVGRRALPMVGIGMEKDGAAASAVAAAAVGGLRMGMAGGEEAQVGGQSSGGEQQQEIVQRGKGEEGGGGESSWLPVPSNMAEYGTLVDLVNMLEEVLGSDDAKRLKPHPGKNAIPFVGIAFLVPPCIALL